MKRPEQPGLPAQPDPRARAPKAARTTRPARKARAARSTRPAGAPRLPRAQQAAPTREQQRRAAWLAGFQYSTFSIVMAAILAIAVVTLVPRLQEVFNQRQQIAALEAEITLTKQEIEDMREVRERWNDKTFLATQARERLFYVMPGEISFLVVNDLAPSQLVNINTEVSDKVQAAKSNWLNTLVRSVLTAGISESVPVSPDVTGGQ